MGFLDNTGLANVLGKIKTALGGKVDKATTVNGHALSGNVSVTKGDVGLGNVNNTSDANKPISTATQTALNGKVSTSTTVNGHALSSNVSITQQDIGIKYSSTAPSNPSDGDIWLQPESESNTLHDTDISSSAITGKSTVNSALTQLNSDVSNLNDQIGDLTQLQVTANNLVDAVNTEHSSINTMLTSNNGIATKYVGTSGNPITIQTIQTMGYATYLCIGFIQGKGNVILAIDKNGSNVVVKDLATLSDFTSNALTITADENHLYFTFAYQGSSTLTLYKSYV